MFFTRRILLKQLSSSQPRRSFAFFDLTTNQLSPKDYNPRAMQKLFTDLEPSKAALNENGELVDPLEEQIDELFNHLTGRQTKGKTIKPMKQPEGQFRLDREIYKTILAQCKDGDVSFVRSKHGKNIVFFGADYERCSMKNMYKAMTVAKPDLVMV